MNKWLEILFGLLFILIAVFISTQYLSWGLAALAILKGGVVLAIAIIGLVFIFIGISDLKG